MSTDTTALALVFITANYRRVLSLGSDNARPEVVAVPQEVVVGDEPIHRISQDVYIYRVSVAEPTTSDRKQNSKSSTPRGDQTGSICCTTTSDDFPCLVCVY